MRPDMFFALFLVCTLAHGCLAQRLPTAEERQEILDSHNRARAETAAARNIANMPELVWSDAAAEYGRSFFASNGCAFEHSPPGSGFGENLAQGHRTWTDAIYTGWHESEIECYDRFAPDWSDCFESTCQCGHFTAVNWAETTEVGCAICDDTRTRICNYANSTPNILSRPAFDEGSGPPCSACSSDQPNCANNLCTAAADDGSGGGEGGAGEGGSGTSPPSNPSNPSTPGDGSSSGGDGNGDGLASVGDGSASTSGALGVGATVGIALVAVLIAGIALTLTYNLWWKKRNDATSSHS